MTTPIPVNLAFEDALIESLLLRILPVQFATRTIYNRGGYGYLKRTVNGFNNAAQGIPFLVGTDLDTYECPPALIDDWLPRPKHDNLLIRVAVREAEAWVLADRDGFAQFLGISVKGSCRRRSPAGPQRDIGSTGTRVAKEVSSRRPVSKTE
jgi:hypothetical protein